MYKKAQISLFIIMGIILLVSLSTITYFSRTSSDQLNLEKNDISPIKNYFDTCVDSISENAVFDLGWRGGLIDYDAARMLETTFGEITYAYIEGENTLPSLDEMEKEMGLYVDMFLDRCFSNLSVLSQWEIEKGDISTDVIVKEKSVLFNIDYPLTLKKGNTINKISQFRTEVPVRLKHIHSIVNNISLRQKADPGFIPFTYFNNFDVNISIYPHKDNIYIYEIIDNSQLMRTRQFTFNVANKFKEWDINDLI